MDATFPYRPITAVWEITFACNMRCKHCGSKCDVARPDELDTDEALDLCDQMAAAGMQYVTLSGGEPLVRPDWHRIAARLKDRGVTPNIITNGWFLDDAVLDQAIAAGISNIGISIDGLEATHDHLRMRGSFARILDALDRMRRRGMPASVITSVHKRNLPELPAMHALFIDKGVRNWQLQIAMPMGHFARRREMVIEPAQVDAIMDFALEASRDGRLRVDLADCMGYYSDKDVEIRSRGQRAEDPLSGLWTGCPAGRAVFGVRCNGDITGCNSIRDTVDQYYLEGNIRERSLDAIWTRPGAFAWNREATKEKLGGFCRTCAYGQLCLGGCTSLRQSMEGNLDHNDYCVYRQAVVRREAEVAAIDDPAELARAAREAIADEEYQSAQIALDRWLELCPDSIEALDLLGLAHYHLDNDEACCDANARALALDPGHAYAHKGMGLGLARRGQLEAGLEHLRKAIALDPDFLDAYHDLALTLGRSGRVAEANAVLDGAVARAPAFAETAAAVRGTFPDRPN